MAPLRSGTGGGRSMFQQAFSHGVGSCQKRDEASLYRYQIPVLSVVRISPASRGNVFADLALPDADEMLAKAELAHEICAIIESEGLTQRQAAARIGIDQPKVSTSAAGD